MSRSRNLRNRTIYLACDHAGLDHKNAILVWLKSEGFLVEDQGAFMYDAEDDFPDFISKAAQVVSLNPETTCAVIFGGSGQGEAMVANRYKNVRATVFYGGSSDIITLSRSHNDANILSIGARFVSIDETKKAIWDWLHGESNVSEKYHRRNSKIEKLQKLN